MHAPNGIGAKKSRSNYYDPVEDAKEALYLNKKGEIVFPAINILSCLREAAVDYKVPGKGKKTYKTYIYAGVSIEPSNIPLIFEGDYDIDLRPVSVGKARVMRARPKFEEWALEFTVSRLDTIINIDNLKDIFNGAGRFKGLGDFRPLFGLFKVTEFEEIIE